MSSTTFKPSRKYLECFNRQHDLNEQRFNTYTPMRKLIQPELLTPTNRGNTLNVSQNEHMASNQQVEMCQSPHLRSTPMRQSMNWRPQNSTDCDGYSFTRLGTRNYNPIYTSIPQQPSPLHHYNKFYTTDMTPNTAVITPIRPMTQFYPQQPMSMLHQRFRPKQQNLHQEAGQDMPTEMNFLVGNVEDERAQYPATIQSQYMRNPYSVKSHETVGFPFQSSQRNYTPDAMFWEQNMIDNKKYCNENYEFQQQQHYDNISLSYRPLKRSFESRGQHLVSATYIPPRLNSSSTEMEWEQVPQQISKRSRHDHNQTPQLLVSLDDHMTDDDYQLKQSIIHHGTHLTHTQPSSKKRTRRLKVKKDSKLQKHKKTTNNTNFDSSRNSKRHIKQQIASKMTSRQLQTKTKVLKQRRLKKDPLYRPPYRIAQMTFARRILPFRKCRLTNPFGSSPYYVVSLPRCVERVLDHNRTNVMLPQNKPSLKTFPSQKRTFALTQHLSQSLPKPKGTPQVSCQLHQSSEIEVHLSNESNRRNADLGNETLNSKTKKQISRSYTRKQQLHSNAKSRRMYRRRLMLKKRFICSPNLSSTGHTMKLRSTSQMRYEGNKSTSTSKSTECREVIPTCPMVRDDDIKATGNDNEYQASKSKEISSISDTNTSVLCESKQIPEALSMQMDNDTKSPCPKQTHPHMESPSIMKQLPTSTDKEQQSSNTKETSTLSNTTTSILCDSKDLLDVDTMTNQMENASKSPFPQQAHAHMESPSIIKEQSMIEGEIFNTQGTKYEDGKDEDGINSIAFKHKSHEDPLQQERADDQKTLRTVRNSFIMTDEQGTQVAKAQINLPKGTKFKIVKVVTDNPKVIALTKNNQQPTIIHEVHDNESMTQTADTNEVQIVPKYKLRPGLVGTQQEEENKWLKNIPVPIKQHKKKDKINSNNSVSNKIEENTETITIIPETIESQDEQRDDGNYESNTTAGLHKEMGQHKNTTEITEENAKGNDSAKPKHSMLQETDDGKINQDKKLPILKSAIHTTLQTESEREWLEDMRRKIFGIEKPSQPQESMRTEIDEVRSQLYQ